MQPKNIFKYSSYYFLIFLTEFLIIAALIYFNKSIDAFFSKKHLFPVTDKFTEVYFKNHLLLEKNILVNSKQKVTFVIHNKEDKDMKYIYNLFFQYDNKKELLTNGTIFVHDNDLKVITIPFSIATTSASAKISITLPEQKENIFYQVNVYDDEE